LADQPPQGTPPEQDKLLQLQVAAGDLLVRGGKYVAWVVGAGLLVTLVYGLVTSWQSHRRRAEFDAVSQVDFLMPRPDPVAAYGLAPRDDLADPARVADLEEGARRYQAAAEAGHGAAAALAWLRVADTYDRLGRPEARLDALAKGAAADPGGLGGFSLDSAYAQGLADSGKLDEAVAHMRAAAGRHRGFFAEQCLVSLAKLQVQAGQSEEARATLAEVRSRFPSSPRKDALAELDAQLGAVGQAGGGG
jgi:tetratricopeptide (TPR) repeat protein